jgi:beta-glucanase (GH16 family)
MRSKLLIAAVPAAVLAVAAGYVAVNQLGGANEAAETATLRMLPPIAQPGAQAAPPSRAKVAIAGELTPVDSGREVTLERLAGTAWVKVGTNLENDEGVAEFTAPVKAGGEVATYRITSEGDDGAVSSDGVRADLWGDPSFSDEFSGDELSDNWSMRGQDYNPAGHRACSKGSPDAVQVSGGAVHLSVLEDPARAGSTCPAKDADGNPIGDYPWRLNGHISTQGHQSFRYGFAAARIKFQEWRGQHGAFWLQPETRENVADDPSRSGAEIDVTEWFGRAHPSGGLTSYAYYKGANDDTVQVGSWLHDPSRFLNGTNDSWWDEFHVFSVEWTPDSYIFRIDGHETFRTNEGVSGQPEYLILSLLSSDYELQYLGHHPLPQELQVDWVRYWEQP